MSLRNKPVFILVWGRSVAVLSCRVKVFARRGAGLNDGLGIIHHALTGNVVVTLMRGNNSGT